MFDKIYNVLLGYVGYLEKKSNKDLESKMANAGNKNYTIFAKLYKDYTGANFQGQAWCAMFISVCFVLAFGLEKAKELLCGSLYAYCPYGMAAFKNKKQLHTTPKKGDVVFFLKNGVAKHTGFVYKVSGNTFYTIEGNTSGASGVVANGGGVCKKSYTVNSNMRFGRPDYSKYETVDKKSLEEIAKAVIAGKYGTGAERKAQLEREGYDYEEVQAKVNELLKGSTSSYYDKYTGDSGKIDVVLEAINVPAKYRGNYTKRKPIAAANGINNYTGKASENNKLIALAKSGKLKKA